MKHIYKISKLKGLLSITLLLAALAIFVVDTPLQAENLEKPRVWASSTPYKPEGKLQLATLMKQDETQSPLRSQGLTDYEVWQTNNELIIGLQFDRSVKLPSNQLVAILRDSAGQPWNITDVSLSLLNAANSDQIWVTLSFDEGVINSRNNDSVIEVGFVTGNSLVVAGSGYQLSAAEVEESGSLTPLHQLTAVRLLSQ